MKMLILTPSCLCDAMDQVGAKNCCEVSWSHFVVSVIGNTAQVYKKELKTPRGILEPAKYNFNWTKKPDSLIACQKISTLKNDQAFRIYLAVIFYRIVDQFDCVTTRRDNFRLVMLVGHRVKLKWNVTWLLYCNLLYSFKMFNLTMKFLITRA